MQFFIMEDTFFQEFNGWEAQILICITTLFLHGSCILCYWFSNDSTIKTPSSIMVLRWKVWYFLCISANHWDIPHSKNHSWIINKGIPFNMLISLQNWRFVGKCTHISYFVTCLFNLKFSLHAKMINSFPNDKISIFLKHQKYLKYFYNTDGIFIIVFIELKKKN